MDMEDKALAGRTLNMLLMSVTPEVSQLDISSLKTLVWNNSFMSVIDATFQLEMGPYVLRAFALSSAHAVTAVSRASRVPKEWVAMFQRLRNMFQSQVRLPQ